MFYLSGEVLVDDIRGPSGWFGFQSIFIPGGGGSAPKAEPKVIRFDVEE